MEASTPRARLGGREHEIVVVARVDLELFEVEIGDVACNTWFRKCRSWLMNDHRGVVVVENNARASGWNGLSRLWWAHPAQHIGLGEQGLRQQYAQLQAGGDLAHGAVVQLGGNPRIRQNRGGARFGV